MPSALAPIAPGCANRRAIRGYDFCFVTDPVNYGPLAKILASRILDIPLAVAAALTCGFYWFVWQESMKGTLLHRYTTEHSVEYIIVAFFIWV